MTVRDRLIEWLVHNIFKYTSLRQAIFEEVHLYDKIDEVLKDQTPGSLYWNDGDGWRCWTYLAGRRKYYFNDIPVDNLGDAMKYTYESLGYEFDMDEIW